MRVTISGLPGAGKSNIADILAQKLKLKRYSVGDYRREAAKKRGTTIEEYNKWGETNIETDKDADEWQSTLKNKENFIIDGRLSWHFIPNSIKIFLTVKKSVGAKRIMLDLREEEKMLNLKEAKKKWKARMKSDIKRFKKYYNINPYKYKHHDFVLDTSNLTREEVVLKVLEFINNKNLK